MFALADTPRLRAGLLEADRGSSIGDEDFRRVAGFETVIHMDTL
jgi:hypothetical protein